MTSAMHPISEPASPKPFRLAPRVPEAASARVVLVLKEIAQVPASQGPVRRREVTARRIAEWVALRDERVASAISSARVAIAIDGDESETLALLARQYREEAAADGVTWTPWLDALEATEGAPHSPYRALEARDTAIRHWLAGASPEAAGELALSGSSRLRSLAAAHAAITDPAVALRLLAATRMGDEHAPLLANPRMAPEVFTALTAYAVDLLAATTLALHAVRGLPSDMPALSSIGAEVFLRAAFPRLRHESPAAYREIVAQAIRRTPWALRIAREMPGWDPVDFARMVDGLRDAQRPDARDDGIHGGWRAGQMAEAFFHPDASEAVLVQLLEDALAHRSATFFWLLGETHAHPNPEAAVRALEHCAPRIHASAFAFLSMARVQWASPRVLRGVIHRFNSDEGRELIRVALPELRHGTIGRFPHTWFRKQLVRNPTAMSIPMPCRPSSTARTRRSSSA